MNQGAIQPILAEANCLADIANAKLKRAGAVHGWSPFGGCPLCEGHPTHQVLVISLGPICEHPKEKVKPVNHQTPLIFGYQCECGARVEPNSFTEVKR